MSWLGKLRKVLGVLTDFLLVGRKRGLWSKKHGPGGQAPERPHTPGERPR